MPVVRFIKSPPIYNLGFLLACLVESFIALVAPQDLPAFYQHQIESKLATSYHPVSVETTSGRLTLWVEPGVEAQEGASLLQFIEAGQAWLAPLIAEDYQLVLAHNGLSSTLKTLSPGYRNTDWPSHGISGGFIHRSYRLFVIQDTIPSRMEKVFYHELGHLWYDWLNDAGLLTSFKTHHQRLLAESLTWPDAAYYLDDESEYFAQLFALGITEQLDEASVSIWGQVLGQLQLFMGRN